MKKSALILFAVSLVTAFSFKIIEPISYNVKPTGTVIHFQGGRVKGDLKALKATLLFDEANPEKSKFSASIDVTGISTGSGMMDKHAKSESALDAEKFPTITFESSAVLKKPDGYHALGKLTLKGVTKEIVLPFTFEHKGEEGLFKGKITLP